MQFRYEENMVSSAFVSLAVLKTGGVFWAESLLGFLIGFEDQVVGRIQLNQGFIFLKRRVNILLFSADLSGPNRIPLTTARVASSSPIALSYDTVPRYLRSESIGRYLKAMLRLRGL
jgi:hypothetical protein